MVLVDAFRVISKKLITVCPVKTAKVDKFDL
jgi:hypothetical protein